MTTIGAIGEILPFAVGIAIFPIPILAVILLLLSRRARANGTGFAIGWIVGVASLMAAFTMIADEAGEHSDQDAHLLVSYIRLMLGLALLFLAIRQWRQRPMPEQEPAVPNWMQKFDEFTPGKAVRTALLLTAGNPKNIGIAAAAGTTVGEMGLGPAQTIAVVMVFTAIASVMIAGLVLYHLHREQRAIEQMQILKHWLINNNSVIMAVLLLVLGTVLLGNAMSALSG